MGEPLAGAEGATRPCRGCTLAARRVRAIEAGDGAVGAIGNDLIGVVDTLALTGRSRCTSWSIPLHKPAEPFALTCGSPRFQLVNPSLDSDVFITSVRSSPRRQRCAPIPKLPHPFRAGGYPRADAGDILSFGPYVLDADARRLTRDSAEVRIGFWELHRLIGQPEQHVRLRPPV